MLRKYVSKFGMATAGVAVGTIMAISPVFAQGTTSTTTSTGDTLVNSIIAAAEAAGLTKEQTKELVELAKEFTAAQSSANENEDENEVEVDEDDTADAAATTTKEKEKTTVKVTFTAPKASEESKGDD